MSIWWSNTNHYWIETKKLKDIEKYLLEKEIRIQEKSFNFIEFSVSYDAYDARARIKEQNLKEDIIIDILSIDKNAIIHNLYSEVSEISELDDISRYCEYKMENDEVIENYYITDRKLAQRFCKKDSCFFKFLSKELLSDQELIFNLICENNQVFHYLPKNITKDKEFIIKLSKKKGYKFIYNYLDDKLKNDPEIEYHFGVYDYARYLE